MSARGPSPCLTGRLQALLSMESAVVSGDAAELHVRVGTHHWRVRGADRNKTPDTLRVALAVTDAEHGGFHLDYPRSLPGQGPVRLHRGGGGRTAHRARRSGP